jgi:hypothetical protein
MLIRLTVGLFMGYLEWNSIVVVWKRAYAFMYKVLILINKANLIYVYNGYVIVEM